MTKYENAREIEILEPEVMKRWAERLPRFLGEIAEMRVAERDVASPCESGQRFMTVYSAKTSDGAYWAMLSTDGMWRARGKHAF